MADHVFLVEDHPIARRGQASVLGSQMGLEVCGEAASAPEALQEIPEADPDIVLVDLSLDEGNGLELIKDLQNRWPELPLLVMSMHDASLYALRCIRAGARGYLMKQRASGALVDAVRQVLDGRIFLCDQMKDRVMCTLGEQGELSQTPLDPLSDRELQVFELLGAGLEATEIAEQLNLSRKTVYSYESRIKEKLGAESTAKLRQRAVIWMKSLNSSSAEERS